MLIRYLQKRHARKTAVRWLLLIESGNLSTKQEDELNTWLTSPLNQAAYIEAEHVWDKGHIQAAKHKSQAVKTKPNFYLAPVLATCSILFFLGIFLIPDSTNDSTTTFQTAISEIRTIALEDGSEITLNSNSQVTIDYTSEKRVANVIRGEVFFAVQSLPNRPFDVVTSKGRVRVVGTQFSVSDTKEEMLVTVLEGKVAVNTSIQNTSDDQVLLTANEQVSIASGEKLSDVRTIDAASKTSWIKNKLAFRGEQLSHVLIELGQHFAVSFKLEDPSLGSTKVYAVIQLTDLDSAINTIEHTAKLEAVLTAEKTYLLKSPKD